MLSPINMVVDMSSGHGHLDILCGWWVVRARALCACIVHIAEKKSEHDIYWLADGGTFVVADVAGWAMTYGR